MTDDSDLARLLIADWIAYCTDDSDWFACLYIKDCAAVGRALSSTWLAIYHQLNLPSEPLYLYHRHWGTRVDTRADSTQKPGTPEPAIRLVSKPQNPDGPVEP